MPEKTNTNPAQSAIPEEVLALIQTARSNSLTAKRITEEIENIEEMSMADLVAITRACRASIEALDNLETKLKGVDDTQPEPPAAALRPAPLSIVEAQAA